MTLDFNETCILNQTLTSDNREEFFKRLETLRENTMYEELRDSVDSLMEKMSALDDESFRRVVSDRNAKKIFTFPPYQL